MRRWRLRNAKDIERRGAGKDMEAKEDVLNSARAALEILRECDRFADAAARSSELSDFADEAARSLER